VSSHPSLVARGRRLLDELVKFGIVGGTAFVVDVAVFNALRFEGEIWSGPLSHKPITAKVLSVGVAMCVAYAGNRHWTWRHRARRRVRRELSIFVLLNGIGMLIAVACLAISHYLLGFTSALADNISANGIGLVLGTAFRFWSYRRWVFPPRAASRPRTILGGPRRTWPPPAGRARSADRGHGPW
jgi:putative flippase GtrA